MTALLTEAPEAKTLRAGIYLRVSQDRSQGRSVKEQETEDRRVCTREGWGVSDVYTDNDLSASRHAKKIRPDFARLQTDIENGALDVLVTWEASRLQRDLDAYVKLRNLCNRHGVLWCINGTTYDLTKSDDRFRTGLDALLSELEADKTRDRVLRSVRANAETGKPHGRVLYGYRREYDPATKEFLSQIPDPQKSLIVQEAAMRVARGETCYGIAEDFNSRNVPIPSKPINPKNPARWNLAQIKRMVTNPGYIGKRVHQGEIVGDAVWSPLLDEETFYTCVRILNDPSRRTTRDGAIKYLLSGFLVCGICGGLARTDKQRGGYRTYTCRENFCTARRVDYVDKFISELVVERLSRPDILQLLSSGDSKTKVSLGQLAEKRVRLQEIESLTINGEISPASFARMEKPLLSEIDKLEKTAARSSVAPVLADVVGPDAGKKWEALSIPRKREVIRALFVEITMKPLPKSDVGKRGFDPRKIGWTFREDEDK